MTKLLPISPNQQRLLQHLASAVASGAVTQQQIAHKTGVHQSQVSRILAGHATRPSPNIERLCRFTAANTRRSKRYRNAEKRLTDTVLRIWDGTDAHAAALEKLLEAMDITQAAFKGKPPR